MYLMALEIRYLEKTNNSSIDHEFENKIYNKNHRIIQAKSCHISNQFHHCFSALLTTLFLLFCSSNANARTQIQSCVYVCMRLCMRTFMCMFLSICGMGTQKEIFDVIDCSYLLLLPIQNIILLIVNTSAFVVSYFRGPRPMSTRRAGGQWWL